MRIWHKKVFKSQTCQSRNFICARIRYNIYSLLCEFLNFSNFSFAFVWRCIFVADEIPTVCALFRCAWPFLRLGRMLFVILLPGVATFQYEHKWQVPRDSNCVHRTVSSAEFIVDSENPGNTQNSWFSLFEETDSCSRWILKYVTLNLISSPLLLSSLRHFPSF